MKSLYKNSIFSVIKTIMSLLFPLITFSYASRILHPDGMGAIEFSKSFVMYFTIIAMLGITNYGSREGAAIRNDKSALSKLTHELLIINFFSAIISCILLLSCFCLIDGISEYKILIIIYGMTIPLNVISMDWLYNAVEDYAYIALRTTIVQVVAVILMLFFVHERNDLWIYAVIQVVASSGNGILNFIHSRKYVVWKRLDNYKIHRHLKNIFLLFWMTIFIQIFTHMDATMLGLFTNSQCVGLYSASSKITTIICSVIVSVSLVTMPRIAYYVANHDSEKIEQISIKIINVIIMIALPSTAGVIILSDKIIDIFCGSSYLEAAISTQILALRIILVPLNSFIVLHLFIPLQEEKKNLISTGCAAILNFIMNMMLIPKFQYVGAAVATVFAEAIELLFNIFFLSSLLSIKKIFGHLWQYCLSTIVMTGMCIIIVRFLSAKYISIVLPVFVGGSVYFGLLFILKNNIVTEIISNVREKIKCICFK